MEEKGPTIKRFRSPPFPYLSLAKATEKASLLFQKAQHHPVGLNVLANAWGMSAQSGSLLKSAAALIQYGLIKDQGSGDARKFQLTEAARRILQDADPASERRHSLIQTAALSPSIHRELWEKFGNPAQLSDALLKNHLLFDRTEVGEAPFSDSSADDVIQTYRDALTYAELDKIAAGTGGDISDQNVNPSPLAPERNGSMTVALGDLIQWESGGVLQFKNSRRVRWISEDGSWIAVEGSETGIPSSEVILEQKKVVEPTIPPEEREMHKDRDKSEESPRRQEWIRTAVGPKTFVSIHVDGSMGPKEIGKLIKLLEVQRDILLED